MKIEKLEVKSVFLLLFCLISVSFADLFSEANKLYEEKDYDSAIVLYLKILETEKNSAVLYNIANSAYRKGDIGAAILYLERAKLLAPDDKDIAANLDFLRKQTIDKFEIPEESFAEQVFNRFQNLLTLEMQIIIIIVLSFLITLLLGFTLFSPKHRTAKIYIIMILALISIILGISAGIKYQTQKNNIRAVIMNEQINAVNEPKGNKTIFTAHEGTILNIIKTENNWYFVSLPNGASGWVQKQYLEII